MEYNRGGSGNRSDKSLLMNWSTYSYSRDIEEKNVTTWLVGWTEDDRGRRAAGAEEKKQGREESATRKERESSRKGAINFKEYYLVNIS